MATIFQKRRAASRRTADLTKLVEQYKKNIAGAAGQYETAFANYQANIQAQMAPFEKAAEQYRTQAMPEYEKQAESYRQALADYQKQLDAIAADPVSPITRREQVGRTWYGKAKFEDVTYWIPKEIPKFTTPAPKLPATPASPYFQPTVTAAQTKEYLIANPGMTDAQIAAAMDQFLVTPQIMAEATGLSPEEITKRYTSAGGSGVVLNIGKQKPEFDTTEFDVKRKQFEAELGREIGERKSARMAAVSRRSTRPLLQGA